MQTSTPSSTRPSGNVATLARDIEHAANVTQRGHEYASPWVVAECLRYSFARVLDLGTAKIRIEVTEDIANPAGLERTIVLTSPVIGGGSAKLEARTGVVSVHLPHHLGGVSSTPDSTAQQVAEAIADFADWIHSTAVAS